MRHAIRLLTRQPGFSAFAILTLGLGIGAATAVFTLVQVTYLVVAAALLTWRWSPAMFRRGRRASRTPLSCCPDDARWLYDRRLESVL